MLELADLWYGNPTKAEVQDFFENQSWEFAEEEYLVRAIRKQLLTPEQKQAMSSADLTIEDMLNGRVNEQQEELVDSIFQEWNVFLGMDYFGQ